jgi:hypothetical protein
MIKIRLPFMLFVFCNLLIGMLAGLIRIGWEVEIGTIALYHGALMVGGFLGSLILLEKVIPLKRSLLFIFPVINAASIMMIMPGLYHLGLLCLVIGAVGMVIVFTIYLSRQPNDLSAWLMVVGACCMLVGHLTLIQKQFYPMAFPWWMAFIFFVIVGERVELSKFLPVTKQNRILLVVFMGLYLLGLLLRFHGIGKYVSGLGLCATGLWLLRHDVISVAIKKTGVTRFSAYALLAGCLALILSGVLLLSLPDLPYAYDATVHTFFLGFAFSMIFAHGPIILPGVLGLAVKPYHPILFVPFVGLELSLIIRILSDLSVLPFEMRLWSGWLSVVCILSYFALLAMVTIKKAIS